MRRVTKCHLDPIAPGWRPLAAAFCLLGVLACGDAPRAVTPAILANAPQAYDGRRVRVEGVLKTFAQPRHYWIEDDALHRVELRRHGGLAQHVDEQISVEGRFSYSPKRGRVLAVDELDVVADTR